MNRARRWAIAAILGAAPLVALAPSSCSTNLSYTYVEPEAGPDTAIARPPTETPDACGLVVTPTIIDYGGLLPGKPLSRTVSVKNLQSTRRLVAVRSSDARFTSQPSQFEIGPSGTTTLEVIGLIEGPGAVNASLTLVSSPLDPRDGGVPDNGGDAGIDDAGDGGATANEGCITTVKLQALGTERGRQYGPQPLDFGSVVCNEAPAAQKLTITSVNADPGTYSASVPAPFAISIPTGPVSASGDVSIDVTSGPLSPMAGVVSRTLSLTIMDKSGTQPVIPIEVKGTALGANLVPSKNALLFIDKAPQLLDVENTGNQRIDIELRAIGYNIGLANGGGSVIPLEPFGFAGSTKSIRVTPTTTGTPPANVTVTATARGGGVLCDFSGLVLKFSTKL